MANVGVRKAEHQTSGVPSRRSSSDFGIWSPAEFFSMSPFALMRRLSEDMDRVFSGGFGEGAQMATWAPPIEVCQHENTLEVCAELPGLRQEDVRVEIADNALTIQGERKREEEKEEKGYRRTERHYGTFRRVIPLPEGINTEQAKARFENGLLTVSVPLPKHEKRGRDIPIETGSAEK